MTNRTRSHLSRFALALACCALLALPAAASAATGGLRGMVTGANGGAPVPNPYVCVKITGSTIITNCSTGFASGEYSFPNLEAGHYLVQFQGTGEYLGQWYDHVESEAAATPVTIEAGLTTSGIDAELPLGSVIEGTVTDAEGGGDLAGIRVCAIPADGNPTVSHCSTSDADGHYRDAGIAAGEYKLRLEPETGHADPNYLREYYPGVHYAVEGSAVQVGTAATVSGIDATMRRGATITGQVVGEGGEGVSGLSVCLYPIPGGNDIASCYENLTQTGGDGSYTIKAVWSGEYKVRFLGGVSNHLAQWYDDQPTRATAGVITVTAPNQLSGVDATLHSGGVISGTLLEAGTAAPIPYADVCARTRAEGAGRCTQAKADGSYRIETLPSGEYLVEFAGPNNSTDWTYVPSFYGGTTAENDATPVPVTAGSEAANIDGEVEKGGTISGLVTDAVSGEPAGGIEACAFSGGAIVGHCDTTHVAGEYTIIGLPSGSYSVRFEPAGGGPFQDYLVGNRHYADQFYPDAEGEAEATPVATGPGTARTGIDVEMHESGGIAGTISGPLGEPLVEAEACVVDSAGDLGGRCGRSNNDGEYEIAGLYPDSYVIYFRPGGYSQFELAGQYSGGVAGFDEATPVTVNGTATTPGVDAQLVAGGTIEGTVTDSFDGSALAGISVCAEATDGPIGNCVESEAGGHYSMSVPPGTFVVKFSLGYWEEENGAETFHQEFGTQFFDGAASAGAATTVTVGSGTTATDVDASLTAVGERANSVSVSKTGNGAGAVVSSPAGIDCGATCSDEFETRKTITLEAEPATDSDFAGWTGACSGTGPCHVRLTAATSVAAIFEAKGAPGKGGTGDEPPATETGTTAPPAGTTPPVTTAPTKPKTTKPMPKKKTCPAGKKLKKVGKAERCVKKPKKHPRKHGAKRH
jgi:Carboxypeptidase regulatory-like domain/Divergent InlB B-repeat domain